MGAETGIEWTDATWNPIGGCSIKSPGCANCYAMKIAGSGRLREHPLYNGVTSPSKAGPVFNGTLTALPDDHPTWTWPLRWRGSKTPKLGPGKPSMIFVGDMSDLFHEDRPDAVIDRVFAVMALAPQHIFQVLTKRADRMNDYLSVRDTLLRIDDIVARMRRGIAPDPKPTWPLLNVWLGVTAEDQERADERIPDLLATPAAKRFISYEPALGPVSVWHPAIARKAGAAADAAGIDWIIAGGESGKDARPAHPDWFRTARDQCAAAGVPFFFKQWGEFSPQPCGPCSCIVGEHCLTAPGTVCADEPKAVMRRVGKRRAGAMLDGRLHREFPA
ncbi:MAG: phage Gp37/Gp68 family protein [Alphaproteobacteria bacterium]